MKRKGCGIPGCVGALALSMTRLWRLFLGRKANGEIDIAGFALIIIEVDLLGDRANYNKWCQSTGRRAGHLVYLLDLVAVPEPDGILVVGKGGLPPLLKMWLIERAGQATR